MAMGVKCSEIISFLEEFAPLHLAEDWDNPGFMLGDKNREVENVLVCLDVTVKVVQEAVSKEAGLIISHHPLIFKGIKSIKSGEPGADTIINLIRNNINVYSSHTNLDCAFGGVNDCLAEALELKKVKNLSDYKEEKVYKLVVFVPRESAEKVRDAISRAGAGFIGNYSDCTFSVEGTGTFRPLEGTNPYIGETNKLEFVTEYRMETIVPEGILNNVVKSMIEAHPYEEVAYDVYPLKISGKKYGMGKVGELDAPMSVSEFKELVKRNLKVDSVRIAGNTEKRVKRVAVFCGSFDGRWQPVIREGADVLVTGDLRHHNALEAAELGLAVIDAGHYATEAVVLEKLVRILSDRFNELNIMRSSNEMNPFITG